MCENSLKSHQTGLSVIQLKTQFIFSERTDAG